MKTIKRLGCLLLVLAMCLALGVTAMAADDVQSLASSPTVKGSITINNAAIGETYEVYQIFDLTYSDDGTTHGAATSYSYAVCSGWYNLLAYYAVDVTATNPTGTALFTLVLGTDNVYYLDSSSYILSDEFAAREDAEQIMADFAQAALAYAKEAKISATKTGKAVDVGSKDNPSGQIIFSELNLGYYLVDSSLGTLCILDSTDPNVVVVEKNYEPVVEKTVDAKHDESEDNTTTVEYEIDVKDIKGVSNLVLHDVMNSQLDLVEEIEFPYGEELAKTFNLTGEERTFWVVIKSSGEAYESTDGIVTVLDPQYPTSDYVVRINGRQDVILTDGCTFEIDLSNYDFSWCTEDMYIEVIYDATVDVKVADMVGNDDEEHLLNDVYLTYGNQMKSTTAEAEVDVYGFEIHKYADDNLTDSDENNNYLADAHFSLTNAEGLIAWFEYDDNTSSYLFKQWAAASTQVEGLTSDIVTTSGGNVFVEGLATGTYVLTETAAPDGYNMLTDTITIVISEKVGANGLEVGTVVYYETTKGETASSDGSSNVVMIQNNSGSMLPGTGGVGTTIFYVIGAVLVCGAAVVLISRKRMNGKAES